MKWDIRHHQSQSQVARIWCLRIGGAVYLNSPRHNFGMHMRADIVVMVLLKLGEDSRALQHLNDPVRERRTHEPVRDVSHTSSARGGSAI